MYLQGLGWRGMEWVNLTQDMGSCECDNEPSCFRKCVKFLNWLKIS